MSKFKTMKVFDCTTMSKKAQDKIYEDNRGHSNDSYIKMYVHGQTKPIEVINPEECSYLKQLKLVPYNGNEILKEDIRSGVKYIIERGDDIVSDWLYDNGAEINDEVLIKYWW